MTGFDDNKAQSLEKTIGLYGDINEDNSRIIVEDLSYIIFEENMIKPSINFIISTNGGITSEMFAIVDQMNYAKSLGFTIKTYGLGKVMSAGILLLACGTRGRRFVGKNTRLMIHELRSDFSGAISSLEEEANESRIAQKSYFSELIANSNLTGDMILDFIKSGRNSYFGSKEAIQFGLADKIL